VPPDVPLILVAGEPAHAQDAATQLLRVGLDRIEGMVDGGFESWQASQLPIAATPLVSAEDLLDGDVDAVVLDVRSPHEWRAGHVPGAINIPVGEIPSRLGELPTDRPIATICEGGYRSSLAASLLAQEGADALNVTGGMAAYRAVTEKTT